MRKQAKIVLVALCFWALAIFVTSCFFIDRDAFIRAISRHLPARALQEKWAALWLVAGIFIVKGWHAAEYAILYCLLDAAARALPPSSRLRWLRRPLLRFTLCVLFAASDEWHQTFVPGRGGTLVDVGIDTLGVTLAALTVVGLERRRARSQNSQG